MTQPDFVFDRAPVQEYWWDFLDESDISPGDEIRVETETYEWKSRMVVIKIGRERDVIFETKAGTRLFVTISSTHPLEPLMPTVRTDDGYDSRGVLKRVEVYKEAT